MEDRWLLPATGKAVAQPVKIGDWGLRFPDRLGLGKGKFRVSGQLEEVDFVRQFELAEAVQGRLPG
jgi:hypothetical protein